VSEDTYASIKVFNVPGEKAADFIFILFMRKKMTEQSIPMQGK
jgi:hypothetical protein